MAEEEQPSVEDGNTEVDLRWAAEKRGPRVANDDTLWSDIDINLSDDRKLVTHTTSSGWATQLCDTWFNKGVTRIEVWCDNTDNLGLYVGVVGRAFLDSDWDEPMRDSADVNCIHGDGRIFVRTREQDRGMQRMATGRVIELLLDMDNGLLHIKLENVVRGKPVVSTTEITGLPEEVTLAACFGGRNQALRIGRCTLLPTEDADARQRRIQAMYDAAAARQQAEDAAERFEKKVQSFMKTAKETAT